MTRQEIIDLIHNEYDPAPAYYKQGDNWDDGSGRIADTIMHSTSENLTIRCCAEISPSICQLFMEKAAARIEELEAALRNILSWKSYRLCHKIARAALDRGDT